MGIRLSTRAPRFSFSLVLALFLGMIAAAPLALYVLRVQGPDRISTSEPTPSREATAKPPPDQSGLIFATPGIAFNADAMEMLANHEYGSALLNAIIAHEIAHSVSTDDESLDEKINELCKRFGVEPSEIDVRNWGKAEFYADLMGLSMLNILESYEAIPAYASLRNLREELYSPFLNPHD